MSGQEYLCGQAVMFVCPECGEDLMIFIPADTGVPEVIRSRDIPREPDDSTGDSDE